MNPRIKELAEQAGYLPDMFGIGHWDMPECKKFAELIIQECMSQVKEVVIPITADAIESKIKKHFGVKE